MREVGFELSSYQLHWSFQPVMFVSISAAPPISHSGPSDFPLFPMVQLSTTSPETVLKSASGVLDLAYAGLLEQTAMLSGICDPHITLVN